MTTRMILGAMAAFLLTGASATQAATKSDAKWCYGTFIRDACAAGTAAPNCSFPKPKGVREEFMGWTIEDGERVYAVYRLASYRAVDVQIDPKCRIRKW